MLTEKRSTNKSRVAIIRAVETPLRFFTLVVLVVEAIFGLLAGFRLSGSERSIVVNGMLVIIAALIIVVTCLALFRPEALSGVRHERHLEKEITMMRAELQEIQAEKDQMQASFQQIEEEKQGLIDYIDKIQSVRLRILGILAGHGSASLSQILLELDIHFKGPERNQVLALLGSLSEEGKIEKDRRAGGDYYTLRKT
jgi:hypothetical protein